jgi:hypothetical protein
VEEEYDVAVRERGISLRHLLAKKELDPRIETVDLRVVLDDRCFLSSNDLRSAEQKHNQDRTLKVTRSTGSRREHWWHSSPT